MHGFGGSLHCLERGFAGLLGGASCLLASRPRRLGRLSQSLLLLMNGLQRLSVPVADLTGFLGQLPEALRFLPGRLVG